MAYGELLWLKDEKVKTHANARAEIARGLLARSKYMWELVTGDDSDGDPCTPRNPQGLTGIDHSGAPWGMAYRHTCTVGEAFVPTATTNIASPKKAVVLNAANPAIWIRSATVNGKPYHSNENFRLSGALDSPYALLELRIYGKLQSAGAGTLTAELGDPNSNANTISGSKSITSTSLLTYVLNFASGVSNGFGCKMVPNGIKRTDFLLVWGGTQPFEVHGWGFHQVRK